MNDAASIVEFVKRTRAQHVAGEIDQGEYMAQQSSTWRRAWRIGIADDVRVLLEREGLSPWGRSMDEGTL